MKTWKVALPHIVAGVLAVGAAATAAVLLTTSGPKTWTVTTSVQLATAEQSAQPGDTVQLSGTFHVPFVPKVSGTATAPITYKGTATFDAAGLTTTLAAVSGRSYLVVDGLSFVNSVPTKPAANRGVILRGSSHITIRNCRFSWMQVQLVTSSDNVLTANSWRYFVAAYDASGHPTTSGDMLNLVLGSNRNTITGNDMKYAGHSLIEVGNGTGNAETNAANVIDGNTLSNPWYKDVILSDNGAGTVVSNNQLLDANSVPTLYSTVAGQVGTLQTSSAAVQFSGENYTLTSNTIRNAVCQYGCVTLGSRYYPGPPSASWIESTGNLIDSNTITGCKGAAGFSFVEFQAPTDPVNPQTGSATPRLTGNTVRGNVLSGNTTGSAFLYHSATSAPPWSGYGGNTVRGNSGLGAVANVNDVTYQGRTTHVAQSLAVFEASDPANVHGNS